MPSSFITRQLIVFLLISLELAGCGMSSASPPPPDSISPTSANVTTVPSLAPAASPLPSDTAPTPQMIVNQSTDWSQVPGIGTPVHGAGVTLTVIHVTDLPSSSKKMRPLIIAVRLRNETYPALTISPAAFTVIHTSGTAFAVKNINFEHPPRDQQELRQNQQLQASLLLSAAFPIEELALQYTPAPNTGAVRIRLRTVSEAPDATLAQLDLPSLIVGNGDLPASFRLGNVFTTIPPTLPLVGVEPPQRFVGQMIEQDDPRQVMHVMILFFNNHASVDAVYTTVAQDGATIAGIGERASWRAREQTLEFRQLTFTRCQAVALILMSGRTEAELIPQSIVRAYAARLDQRLQGALCP